MGKIYKWVNLTNTEVTVGGVSIPAYDAYSQYSDSENFLTQGGDPGALYGASDGTTLNLYVSGVLNNLPVSQIAQDVAVYQTESLATSLQGPQQFQNLSTTTVLSLTTWQDFIAANAGTVATVSDATGPLVYGAQVVGGGALYATVYKESNSVWRLG